MKLTVQGKHVEVGDSLRQYIEGNLPDSIGKYFDNTTDTTVTFSKRGAFFGADIQVHVSKRVIVQGHGEGRDAYAALDEATEHVLKRLRRYKRRLRDHKQQLPQKEIWPTTQYVLQPEPLVEDDQVAVDEPDQPLVVAETASYLEELSVGEAVMRMDLNHVPALMFRNAGSGRLNMVYVRHDGNIGWVDPNDA